MNATLTRSIRHLLETPGSALPELPGEPQASRELRRQGLDSFLRKGLDLRGQEDWKYSDLSPLTDGEFTPFAGQPEPAEKLRRFLPASDTHKLVFVNGLHSKELSDVGELPDGVVLQPLSRGKETGTGVPVELNEAPLTALATAFWRDGLELTVPDGIELDRPLEIFFLTDERAAGHLVAVRNLVRAGKGSNLTVVEHFAGSTGGPVLNLPVPGILCGENATVRHLKIVREEDRALHYGSTQVRQLADSSFTSREFALGRGNVRRELHLDLDGEGAACDLTALYMASAEQRMDMRTRVRHNVPGCRTSELYKGVLDGRAHTVFDGLIRVARDAQRTEAFQTNRSLVLSDDTVSCSIPRLEIYADDVKCSHGSTTGQLGREEMFYLRSRGFDAALARRMLSYAFASEVLERVPVAELREELTTEIHRILDGVQA